MGKLKVLDCTLRDGGYCNEWKFGENNIHKIIDNLVESGIEIIECGFLTNLVQYDSNVSKYTDLNQIAEFIPENRKGRTFVVMMNYGEYKVDNLPENDGKSVEGIRVAFHKKDLTSALDVCRKVKEKGYRLFVQAMVSLSYSDEEFLDLIQRVNDLEPEAFYIVDSFGVMKRKDLIRLFYMVEHDLKPEITIGYHCHNNMQLAYSNAQALVDIRAKHDMVIDSSIFGMGRGAGNLNTELFVEYLNDNLGTDYKLKPLLNTIDEVLNRFHEEKYWGYSLPNYLSAKHNTHPNYADFLDAKKTLTVENMDEIFTIMDDNKRVSFDKEYMEQLYLKYLATGEVQETHLSELKEHLFGKTVVLIAPGKSSITQKNRIISYLDKNRDAVSIGVNFNYSEYDTDYIFLSNLRRYRELDKTKLSKCIVTSNIPKVDVYLQTKYSDLLNDDEVAADNAGMMLIKFLVQMGSKKVLLAGIDGYSTDISQNYVNPSMNSYRQNEMLQAMNKGVTHALRMFSKNIDIEFLTTPNYVTL